MTKMKAIPALLVLALAMAVPDSPAHAQDAPRYDVVIRDGTVYDGWGGDPYRGDVAILGDSVVAIGAVTGSGRIEVDATGMAVAPGFINMLSWATETLIEDPRSLSDVRQGVTLEVFGEGWSMGPLTDAMREEVIERQGDIRFDVPWTTLGEYLDHLVERGVTPNVASFVGATTLRIHELGYEDRPPSDEELGRMQDLVREAMEEGALGVGSSLIYAPAFYSTTDELVGLMEAAAEYDGMYITHMRSEGNRLLQAVDEVIEIARRSGAPAQIYHLKAAGEENWPKMDTVIARIEAARAEGLRITADMYTYTAGATGLDAAMPPWVQEGGHDAWVERLRDPDVRARVADEMQTPTDAWENLYLASGSPERVLLVGFKQDSLKYLTGKTLAEVARMRGTSPEETAMRLVVQDDSRVGTVYFLMSEENIRKQIRLPWMSFDSDAGSMAPEGVFLESNPHPRAYGNFARLLGRYVRDQQVITLEEAVRRLTTLPATNLGLRRRGALQPGYLADVVVFDPETVTDHATFDDPHQLATGVEHVLVNGVPVLRDGEHTGELPGRVVRGPGWSGWESGAGPAPARTPSPHLRSSLRETVATIFEDGWSRGEVEVFSTTLADSVLFHYAGSPREMSRADMTAAVLRWREAFPDLRMDVHELVVEGDLAAARMTLSGTHEGEWAGAAPTGKRVEMALMMLMRFEDGVMVELWETDDQLGLRRQLGIN